MKRIAFLVAAGVICMSLLSCAGNRAIPPSRHPDSSDWQELFASDLSDAIYPEGVWTFENGILTASEDQNIWTKRPYDNFIIDLEFKTEHETNSGVIVYCSNLERWIPNSVEIQIADDFADKWASSPKTWQCGAFFGHKAPATSAVKRPGEWNRYTITCQDNMIYVLLNGVKVNEMDMTRYTSADTNPDGSEIPEWLSRPVAALPTKGRIGFQGKHAGAPIYFRNMKLRIIE